MSGGPWGAWWSANTLVLLASIALGLMTATTGLLWVGQVYLVMTNQTTYEEQKEHSLTGETMGGEGERSGALEICISLVLLCACKAGAHKGGVQMGPVSLI